MIRVLVVDHHEVVRLGLRSVFASRIDIEVVGEAAGAEQALELARTTPADVALVALELPDRAGTELIEPMKALQPGLNVLVMSGQSEDRYALDVLKAGAAGFVSKASPTDAFPAAVMVACQGRRYVSPRVGDLLAKRLRRPHPDAEAHKMLSEREYEVFLGLATGKNTKDIALDLRLSNKTVSTYRSRILEKLSCRSNAEFVVYAMKHALIG